MKRSMFKRIFIFIFVFSILVLSKNSFSQELLPANEKVLDSLKSANTGKVILFNYWASWCKPCVEEFPDIMKLNSELKDKDFKLIFISLDFGDDLASQTKKFLTKMNVDFTTYYNGFAKDEDLINYMDKEWNGGIPGTFIFDKSGKLKK
ncbi:MAG: TlpA disulfide reductase family protein, partial [Ignavibacteria bacterium]